MNCYQEIIKILKNKNVVIIPNVRLITKKRATTINVQNELTINNIKSQIIDIDTDNINLNNYDTIYFTGKEPKILMEAIYKKNLFNKINNFITNEEIIIGQSADAIIFNKQYLDTTTEEPKIMNDGFNYGKKKIVPHFEHLPEELLKQLANNILKIKDTEQLIKL